MRRFKSAEVRDVCLVQRPLVAPATMESLDTENRMLRQLLVDTLVEPESVREQMRGRRIYPRNR